MSPEDEHPPAPPPRRPSRARLGAWITLVLAMVAPALLLWSWSRPRPAPPREMPPLALAPRAVRAQIAADREAAARAPDGALEEARRAVYDEAHEAEVAGSDPPAVAMRRRARLRETLDTLAEAHGEAAVAAVRAADLERAERALRGTLPEVQRDAALGGLPDMMRRWRMADAERQRAPRFVVRTAFKARWNALYGREPTEGLSEVERRAHWGWLALHADGAPLDLRLDGLARYAEAGGERIAEARGVLLYEEERGDDARAAFEEAARRRPTFRLRNHALAASLR
ncbi:MAG TPA: hypothetical protein RMH99_14340 [Sandaracinaceae bacterium LLY-WYZ-13_1]|nr:hypothetical protein [Sandaracinaceae bacterium LLY-WYZ-13_1]